jgi:hypothetical protein
MIPALVQRWGILKMTGIVGEPFENFGNTPECVIDRIPAYEILDGGLIRIFVCKTFAGRLVLDHTDIMTRSMMIAIGTRLLEIADAAPIVPEVIHWMEGRKAH